MLSASCGFQRGNRVSTIGQPLRGHFLEDLPDIFPLQTPVTVDIQCSIVSSLNVRRQVSIEDLLYPNYLGSSAF